MEAVQQKIWNATLYLRLSREDGDNEESGSIAGQRALLRDYLRDHPDIREYQIRIDDGWSGSSFERPDFQKMIEDVKAGRTDCIICKDLSRFGRNYLDAGEYIEKIFPFLGVRFIAVNDNYDSLHPKSSTDNLMIPFKNLINESYCRDISVKIRTQLEIKRKNGQFIGAFAAYGYFKDAADKNKLVVDEYAADVVRKMFRWKIEGYSPADIANRLNENGILSPLEYKRSLGIKAPTSFKVNPQALWSASSVIHLLKNPVYIGTLVQGRTTTPSYKVHKKINKPESEWNVIPDCHEAIINREDFDCVQRILALDTRRGEHSETVPLFSGMIFCADCGSNMIRKTVPSGKKKLVYYVCAANRKDKNACTSHSMPAVRMEEIVLTALQQHIRTVCDMEKLLSAPDTVRSVTPEACRIQRQLDKKMEEYEKLQRLIVSLHENLNEGIIDRDEYANLKQVYSLRSGEAMKQMDTLRENLQHLAEHGSSVEWVETFRKYQNIAVLDRAAVVTLIDHIIIHENKTVEIIYRYHDEFTQQMEASEWQDQNEKSTG